MAVCDSTRSRYQPGIGSVRGVSMKAGATQFARIGAVSECDHSAASVLVIASTAARVIEYAAWRGSPNSAPTLEMVTIDPPRSASIRRAAKLRVRKKVPR